MSQSFCGNDCSSCEAKVNKRCPGCRVGPGQKYGTKCDIARCAIEMNVSNCYGCSNAEGCAKRKRRVSAAANRVYMEEKSIEELQRKGNACAVLGEMLTVLFWLLIGSMILNLVCGVIDSLLQVELFTNISTIVVSILQACIFLKLGRTSVNFRIAGIFGFASIAFSVLNILIDYPALVLAFGLCQLATLVAMEFLQFLGYIAVTEEFESDLSQKWHKLWVVHFVLLLIIVIAVALSPLIGLLILPAVVGYIVTSVIKLVRLYQTASFFQEYHD